MNDRWTVQLPPQTYLALAAYLQESGSGADASAVAAAAIDQWLAQARARAETSHTSAGRGYQWKSLFLPSAARLRMNFDGTCHYAEVKGDEIVFQGESVSPAQMANRIAGGTRNAWRDLWILFPGERHWKLASLRRRQAQDLDKLIASPPAMIPPLVPTVAPDDVHLKRLANILERALAERGPSYRRRSDHLDGHFDDH
jgi:hypothetical protein